MTHHLAHGPGEIPVAGLLLAAGAGRRMGMPKALVRSDDGVAWVVRGARLLLASGCSPVVVVVGAHAAEVEAVLAASLDADARLRVVRALDWAEGMSASLRVGLLALGAVGATERAEAAGSAERADVVAGAGAAEHVEAAKATGGGEAAGGAEAADRRTPQASGVVITLVDLPDLVAAEIDRVVARALGEGDRGGHGGGADDDVAFEGARGRRALVQATYQGRPGHPVFVGREHWNALADEITGDRGARAYLEAHGAELVECGDLGSGADVDRLLPPSGGTA
ncbi:nucleotidyltransferase family protein [Subtercola lobariae]|nr:NTP transferase domain-containing protein [Subtercola lobariae]